MIASLDFVAVPTRDPDRARSFYVDTLGLRPDEKAQYEFWVGQRALRCGSRSGWGSRS